MTLAERLDNAIFNELRKKGDIDDFTIGDVSVATKQAASELMSKIEKEIEDIPFEAQEEILQSFVLYGVDDVLEVLSGKGTSQESETSSISEMAKKARIIK